MKSMIIKLLLLNHLGIKVVKIYSIKQNLNESQLLNGYNKWNQ